MALHERRRGSERGQSMVELALLVPLLALILLGLIDFGRVFGAFIVITNAAREGARYGSQYPNDIDGMKVRTIREADWSGISLRYDEINVQISGGTAPGQPLALSVMYPYSAVSTLISTFWGGGNLMLQARAVMVIQ